MTIHDRDVVRREYATEDGQLAARVPEFERPFVATRRGTVFVARKRDNQAAGRGERST
jgi:hypothetical protein